MYWVKAGMILTLGIRRAFILVLGFSHHIENVTISLVTVLYLLSFMVSIINRSWAISSGNHNDKYRNMQIVLLQDHSMNFLLCQRTESKEVWRSPKKQGLHRRLKGLSHSFQIFVQFPSLFLSWRQCWHAKLASPIMCVANLIIK